MSQSFADFIGQTVVVDVDGPVIYLGRLAAVSGEFLTLEDVDVHNLGDSGTPRERYVIDAKKLGIRSNRRQAQVRLARVVGVSRLEDVIEF
jgi:hypothetical protein